MERIEVLTEFCKRLRKLGYIHWLTDDTLADLWRDLKLKKDPLKLGMFMFWSSGKNFDIKAFSKHFEYEFEVDNVEYTDERPFLIEMKHVETGMIVGIMFYYSGIEKRTLVHKGSVERKFGISYMERISLHNFQTIGQFFIPMPVEDYLSLWYKQGGSSNGKSERKIRSLQQGQESSSS